MTVKALCSQCHQEVTPIEEYLDTSDGEKYFARLCPLCDAHRTSSRRSADG